MAGWSVLIEKRADGTALVSAFRAGDDWYKTATTFTLSTTDWRRMTQADFDVIDAGIQSDGCSGPALQFFKNACIIHDFYYRTHRNFDGTPITRREADSALREYIMLHSALDGMSPMAHWRYAMLRLFGDKAWHDDARGTPLAESPRLYRWPNCSEARVQGA